MNNALDNAKTFAAEIAAIEITERILAQKKAELETKRLDALVQFGIEQVKGEIKINLGDELPSNEQLVNCATATWEAFADIQDGATLTMFVKMCQSAQAVYLNIR